MPRPRADEGVDRATIEEKLKLLDTAELSDEVKAALTGSYRAALKSLEERDAQQAADAEFERLIESAPGDLASARDTRQSLPEEPEPLGDQSATPLAELESQLEAALATEKTDRENMTKAQSEPARRVTRRQEMSTLLNKARQRLPELEAELARTAAAELGEAEAANRLAQLAERAALEATIESLDAEKRYYDASAEWAQIQADIAAARSKISSERASMLRERVNQRRQREAEEQLQAAQTERFRGEPALAGVTERNAELAQQRAELAQKISEASRELQESDAVLASVTERFQQARDKVGQETGRLSRARGEILRRQQSQLPRVRRYRRQLRVRQEVIDELELTRYGFQEDRNRLAIIPQRVDELLAGAGSAKRDDKELKDLLKQQLENQRQYYDSLLSDYNQYYDILLRTNDAEQQIIDQTSQFRTYINERILWTRSASVMSLSDVSPGLDAARWLISAENWHELWRALVDDFTSSSMIWATAALVFLVLAVYRRRVSRSIAKMGAVAARRSSADFGPTRRTIVATIFLAVLWPSVLGFVAWRLGLSGDSEFVRDVAIGGRAAAWVLLEFELVRQMFRPDGLADAHFGWSRSAVALSRRYLTWATVAAVPLWGVLRVVAARGEPLWDASLARWCFCLFALLLTIVLARLFHTRHGALADTLESHPEGWANRLRQFWYPILVLCPASVLVMAVAGYLYTAVALTEYFVSTMMVLLLVVATNSTSARWVLLRRRNIARQLAHERWEAAVGQAAEEDRDGPPPEAPDIADEPVDLAGRSAQVQRLVGSVTFVVGLIALLLIWEDVLPALAYVKGFTPWHWTSELTMADLMSALLVVFVTAVAVRNIPGVIEFTVLQRLRMDAGARYAATNIARYVIILLGILLASNALGISWQSVGWLAAAVSVGLGFGLQEIFANVVSGLIILFERPIRVGDVITLGDVTGVVTRIRTRATTITNWDRQELIVPNKDLITGRLLNWTLSNSINRIIVNVGVSYESDVRRAKRALAEVAGAHQLILHDPAPVVTFEGFGDSTLNLVLRCYLPDMSHRLTTIDDLHTAICERFRQENIEIAFPQRDIHIRTVTGPFPALTPAEAEA